MPDDAKRNTRQREGENIGREKERSLHKTSDGKKLLRKSRRWRINKNAYNHEGMHKFGECLFKGTHGRRESKHPFVRQKNLLGAGQERIKSQKSKNKGTERLNSALG